MNYTVKLILRQVKNTDGNNPIYLRITIARQTAYLATGYFINEKQWNEKTESIKATHPNAAIINPSLSHKKQQVIQKLVELQVQKKEISAKDLKLFFTGKDLNNIFDFIDNFIEDVKHKRASNTIMVYAGYARKLEKFIGSRQLAFEEIDHSFLTRYEAYLRGLGLSGNYIHALFKTLRTFFNAAKKRGLISNYPFDKYENPVYKSPLKDYLTMEELDKWERFADETTDKVLKQCAVWFLFGCYSGLRISDWHLFDHTKHIKDNRLRLRPTKTKNKWVEMIISKPLARNLERMKEIKLPLKEKTINQKLKVISGMLGIEKRVITHSGRKSFAVTICATQGVSLETCAMLMGITVSVCAASYYNVTQEKIDNETAAAWKDLK